MAITSDRTREFNRAAAAIKRSGEGIDLQREYRLAQRPDLVAGAVLYFCEVRWDGKADLPYKIKLDQIPIKRADDGMDYLMWTWNGRDCGGSLRFYIPDENGHVLNISTTADSGYVTLLLVRKEEDSKQAA